MSERAGWVYGLSYEEALAAGGARVREPEVAFGAGGEVELQARWFAGEFGRDWATTDGRVVRIEDFGRWNHEAGPDFVEVRLRLDGEERRGAVELDLDVRDWERHGHATNPAFRETVAHLFVRGPAARFFTRTCDHREVPQIHLVPPAEPPPTTPGAEEIVTTDPEAARRILEAAARHRLDLKARALRHGASVHGEDEAWFAALAVALGYKRNQTPFLLLAQRARLRDAAAAGGEALLFGVAGFLESLLPSVTDRKVQAYLRGLWERWWAERARCERWILPRDAWQFAGVRPANHPHRRVAALAGIAAGWAPIRRALAAAQREAFGAALEAVAHPFWDRRFNLHAAELVEPQALIGSERILDIVLNLYHPLAVAKDEGAWREFLAQRGPTPAAVMRETAARFFAGAVNRSLRLAVTQQGLLQVARDFRLASDPGAFVAALRRVRSAPGASEGSTASTAEP